MDRSILRSSGGAHFDQAPFIVGELTPWNIWKVLSLSVNVNNILSRKFFDVISISK